MNGNLEEMRRLEEENRKLKEDNEMLLGIVGQMRVTLNRLVNYYVINKEQKQQNSSSKTVIVK